MEATRPVAPVFQREPPIFYAGDELHRIKQDKVQRALAASGFDAFIFFKAEAVRYITDFYAKGYRPFMEPEYFVVVLKDRPPAVGYISGSDDLRIKIKSDIQDARKLPPVAQWATTIGQILSDYGLTRCRLGTDLMPTWSAMRCARRCRASRWRMRAPSGPASRPSSTQWKWH